jgi:pseudolysin
MRFILLLAPLALIAACSLDPAKVTQVDMGTETGTTTIATEKLGSDGDFSVGYANGFLRTDQVTIEWAHSAEDEFLCYKVLRDGVVRKVIQDVAVSSYTDSPVMEGRGYQYAVATFLESGLHSQARVEITTPHFDAPDSIEATTPSATSEMLSWRNHADYVTGFLIERSDDGVEYLPVGETSNTYYIDDGVVSDTYYYYRVSARSPYEETATSDAVHVLVRYDLSAPRFLEGYQILGGRSVQLRWEDRSRSELAVDIYRALEDGTPTYSLVGSVPTNRISYVDADTLSSLRIGETYSYYLVARGQWESSLPSDTLSVTIADDAADRVIGFESGDFPSGTQQVGDAEWVVQSSEVYEGQWAVRSGSIDHYENSTFAIDFSVPANSLIDIRFAYKISSEACCDYLAFWVDGHWITMSASGEVGWEVYQEQVYSDASGVLQLWWQYIKDGSISDGADAAWVDDIRISW